MWQKERERVRGKFFFNKGKIYLSDIFCFVNLDFY